MTEAALTDNIQKAMIMPYHATLYYRSIGDNPLDHEMWLAGKAITAHRVDKIIHECGHKVRWCFVYAALTDSKNRNSLTVIAGEALIKHAGDTYEQRYIECTSSCNKHASL